MTENDIPDVILDVDGMMCQKNCGNTVLKAIQSLEQVQRATVTYASGEAHIWLKSDRIATPITILIDIVESVGYGAVLKKDNRRLFGDDQIEYKSEETDSVDAENKPDLTISVNKVQASDIKNIEESLLAIEGVFTVRLDISNQLLNIWGYAEKSTITEVLAKKGFIQNKDIEKQKNSAITNTEKLVLDMSKVQGLKAVTDYLTTLPSISMSVDGGKVILQFDPSVLSRDELIKTLATNKLSGFITSNSSKTSSNKEPVKREFVYSIRGMSCGACAVKIEKVT